MSARLEFEGLDELREQLRHLPETLAGEASRIVQGAANSAAVQVKRTYPMKSGNLLKNVTVESVEAGRFAAGARLRSTARHAWLYEKGSGERKTRTGANRGAMPAADQFIPIAIRERYRMYGQLADLLRRHGFEVTGA